MKIILMKNSMFCKFPCLFCGRSFKPSGIAIEVYLEGAEYGALICEGCFIEGADGAKENLRKHASELVAHSNWLCSLAELDFDMPTIEEYKRLAVEVWGKPSEPFALYR
jgi:hypothetical protein